MDFHQDDQPSPRKTAPRIDWKILAGLAVVLIFAGYIFIRFFVFVSGSSASAHEKTLASYYEAAVKNDTNILKSLVTENFTDESPAQTWAAGRYEIFAYSHEKTAPDAKSGPESTNGRKAVTDKMLFSVTAEESGRRVSYLLEAYFTQEKSQPRLVSIRKVSVGRNIGR